MNKIILIIIIAVVALATIMIVRLVTTEDDWICQGGQWVKHGNPSTPAPAVECQ